MVGGWKLDINQACQSGISLVLLVVAPGKAAQVSQTGQPAKFSWVKLE